MIETIVIPVDDRFQVITEHEGGELVYDPSFLGIERTDGFIAVQITLAAGRTRQAKTNLYRRISELLQERQDVRPQDVQGTPIPIDRAPDHIAGFSLLNDWSARDVQRWEMFPLGPFLSKSFATSVSAWVVTAEALLPFRAPALQRPDGDPTPLPYLFNRQDQADGGIDVALRVLLSTSKMRAAVEEPVEIIVSNARYLYWTPAQMVAHRTINGCNLVPGDLIGTGTISGPTDAELGSMLELTVGGTRPVTLPNGERRTFLLDGDQITLVGRCERAGFVPIGFGAYSGTIVGVQEAEAEIESRDLAVEVG